jgi:RNA polymerase sigma-70 factor, ECF subfamily
VRLPVDAERARRDAELDALLQQAACGDAEAFARFYDVSHALAQALARRIVRGPEVDDVLAEAFFQAWREAPRFDAARGSAASWLLLMVRSRAIDTVRRRLPAADQGGDDELLAALATPAPGPDDTAACNRTTHRLHAALALLSSQQRWVITLAYFRDLSHAAISQATGLPLGTVKSLALRGQRKLRQAMTGWT